MSPVAAPADRRFRRAHVKPGAHAGGAGAGCVTPLRRYAADRASLRSYRRLPGVAQSRRRRTSCASIASSSAATSGCRRARCWPCSSGLRGREPRLDRSGSLAPAPAGVALGARRRAAALAAVDGRGRRSRSGSRSASAASNGDLYLVDERGVDHRRVRAAVRRISTCRSSTASSPRARRRGRRPTRRARSWPPASSRRSRHEPAIAAPAVADRRAATCTTPR